MIITTLFYALPLISFIFGCSLLLYRNTLTQSLGQESHQLIFLFSIPYILLGTLGFILVYFGYIDFMLIWIVVMILFTIFTIYVYKTLLSNQD